VLVYFFKLCIKLLFKSKLSILFIRFFINLLFFVLNFLVFSKDKFLRFTISVYKVSWRKVLMRNIVVLTICGLFVKCVNFFLFIFTKSF
jgi:hypothetical protein